MSRRLSFPTRGVSQTINYTDDGRWIITSEQDGSVRCWEAATSNAPFAMITGWPLAISPDTTRLISRHWGPVRCWDTDSGELRWAAFIGQGYCNSGAFSPDGALLAIGPMRRVVLLDADTGKELVRSAEFSTGHLLCMTFSPDGKNLFVGCGDGSVNQLSAADGWKSSQPLAAKHESPVIAMAISPDGRWLATASGEGKIFDDITVPPGADDASIRLWNPLTGELVRVLGSRPPRVNALCFSPDGASLYSADMDGDLMTWGIPDGRVLQSQHVSDSGLSCIGISPDGKRFILGEPQGSIHLIERTDVNLGHAQAGTPPVVVPRAVPGYCHFALFNHDQSTLINASAGWLARYEVGPPLCGFDLREHQRQTRALFDRVHNDFLMDQKFHEVRALAAEAMQDPTDVLAMVQRDGETPSAMINKAFLHSLYDNRPMTDYVNAARTAQRCVELVPESGYYRDTFSLALLRSGRLQDALTANDAAAQRDNPDDPSALHQIIRTMILAKLGDAPAAKKSLEKSRALMSSPSNAAFSATLSLLAEAEELLRSKQ